MLTTKANAKADILRLEEAIQLSELDCRMMTLDAWESAIRTTCSTWAKRLRLEVSVLRNEFHTTNQDAIRRGKDEGKCDTNPQEGFKTPYRQYLMEWIEGTPINCCLEEDDRTI